MGSLPGKKLVAQLPKIIQSGTGVFACTTYYLCSFSWEAYPEWDIMENAFLITGYGRFIGCVMGNNTFK